MISALEGPGEMFETDVRVLRKYASSSLAQKPLDLFPVYLVRTMALGNIRPFA
jgi:hypothetical protein